MDVRMAKRPERDPGDQPSDPKISPAASGRSDSPPAGRHVKRGTSPTPAEEEETDSSAGAFEVVAALARQAAPPSPAEHARLIAEATRGDFLARESLANAHLGWVAQAAEERSGRGLSPGDLFQEGSLGLMRAIDDFGASGRLDFEVFARELVADQMERALRQEDQAQEDARRLIQAAEDYQRAEFSLRRELGRDATSAELAAKLEWPRDRIEGIASMVEDARRRHDEELLIYLEPDDPDLDGLLEAQEGPPTPGADDGGPARRPGQRGEGPGAG
jgi:RNA polymerase sigma factor (sigma-70 family)